jgi:hypothetical protein
MQTGWSETMPCGFICLQPGQYPQQQGSKES